MSIDQRSRTRRHRSGRIIGGAVTAAVLASGAVYAATADDRSGGTGGIQGSYAFDPYDKPKLMDYSDEVFLGRVIEKVRNVDDIDTIWTVEILDSIKGALRTGRVQVQQHGYIDGDGHVHEFGDSPMLRPGRDYLLLTTAQQNGGLFLLSGPRTSPRADTPERKAQLRGEYSEAAKVESGLVVPPRL